MNLAQDFFSLLGLGISAFIASNIDDTFILILLFSSLSFQIRHIIVGQFAGIGVLIMLSALWGVDCLSNTNLLHGTYGINSCRHRHNETYRIKRENPYSK